MSSGKPIVRQISWLSLFPQLLVAALLVTGCCLLIGPSVLAVWTAMAVYLILSFTLKQTIPRSHRTGMAFLKSGDYARAAAEFEKSYAFFTRHSWIDRARFLTLLSSSRVSYTEMALLNLAFCCTQTGDGAGAKRYYEKALEQFPDSEMAKTALKMINSVENPRLPAPKWPARCRRALA